MTQPTDTPSSSRETLEQRIELALALLRRKESFSSSLPRLRDAFPSAPRAIVEDAAFHVYVDGAEAALDWLADAESFLRGDVEEPDVGKAWHLLYHIYNWSQLHDLLVVADEPLIKQLAELKRLASDEDWQGMKHSIDELMERVEGHASPPHLGH